MFAFLRPAHWVASLALVVAASTVAQADDVYVDNGVFVKQLPPWRQRLLQKRQLRQSGPSEIVIQGPPAIRVPSPSVGRRSMRPLFGPVRYPATIISPEDQIVITSPKTIVTKPDVVIEPPARILSSPAVADDVLDELPPVGLPPARDAMPASGAVISTPAAKPALPPIELEPEPPLAAPTSAPRSDVKPLPKPSA